MTANRDPRVLALLAGREPVSVIDVAWARPLRISAYLGPVLLPNDLVTGVRCLVTVGDQVVMCTNQKGLDHAWPGGRRNAGETDEQTACREVYEETGWNIAADSIARLGFLHLFNLGEPNPPYPHPDTLQVVVTATATDRAADDWTDVARRHLRHVGLRQKQECLGLARGAWRLLGGRQVGQAEMDGIGLAVGPSDQQRSELRVGPLGRGDRRSSDLAIPTNLKTETLYYE